MVKTFNEIFRDFETDGVPASGVHEPIKVDIRQALTAISAITSSSGTARVYTTRDLLYADLSANATAMAWVVSDPTAAYNGIYQKVGATTTGSWTRVADLPYSFIRADNSGAGTPDAILATTAIPVSSSALITLPIAEDSTGSPITVSFNGGTAYTIKTVSGNDASALTTGMIVLGMISGSTFRLLNDQNVSALVAQAEAAQEAAEIAAQLAIDAAAAAYSYSTPDELEADTTLTYTPAQPGTVVAGLKIFVKDGARLYTVAASAASDNHVVTDGGVKLYVTGSTVTPEHFFAKGDDSTDDWAALQTALDYCKTTPAFLRLTPGKTYRYSAALDASLASGTNPIWGIDGTGAYLSQNFTGHGLVGFDFSRPGARAGGVLRLRGLRFLNGPAAIDPPVMLDISGTANFQIDDLWFQGSANTQMRMDSMYNNRMDRITGYFGGRHFPYKDASAVTFSITSGATTLTSSAAHFAAGDVGRIISLENVSGRREFYTISAYTNTTTVTVSAASVTTYSAAAGNWEHARITVTGTTATIIGENWPTDCVGHAIYIAGTDAAALPSRKTIVSRTSGTVVELDSAVATNVTNSRFCLPAFDMGQESYYTGGGATTPETNDCKIYNLWIEYPRGVGLVINESSDLYIYTPKIHGDATPDGNTAATANHAWLIKAQAAFDGTELHADDVGNSKIVLFGSEGKTYFGGHTRVVLAIGQNLTETNSFATGGVVEFDSVECIGTVSQIVELISEIEAKDGKLVIDSFSQSGSAPVFFPKVFQGVRTITTDANENHVFSRSQSTRVLHTQTLTANRQLNLGSVSGGGRQMDGDTVLVTRTGGGAFNLQVRDGASAVTLKALATGQWCTAVWNHATGAWYLGSYGTL